MGKFNEISIEYADYIDDLLARGYDYKDVTRIVSKQYLDDQIIGKKLPKTVEDK